MFHVDRFIAQEQVDGLAYNEKSDIWALGCLTYELICLRYVIRQQAPALLDTKLPLQSAVFGRKSVGAGSEHQDWQIRAYSFAV